MSSDVISNIKIMLKTGVIIIDCLVKYVYNIRHNVGYDVSRFMHAVSDICYFRMEVDGRS